MPQNLSAEQRAQARLLANRLRTLLDVAAAGRDGEDVTFTEISDYLTRRGISLSRGRWQYMLGAERVVDDAVLLRALSDYFAVEPEYLLGEDIMPRKVEAELDLLRAMRAARVRTYAARTLGDLSPDTLNAITQLLDAEVASGPPLEQDDHTQ